MVPRQASQTGKAIDHLGNPSPLRSGYRQRRTETEPKRQNNFCVLSIDFVCDQRDRLIGPSVSATVTRGSNTTGGISHKRIASASCIAARTARPWPHQSPPRRLTDRLCQPEEMDDHLKQPAHIFGRASDRKSQPQCLAAACRAVRRRFATLGRPASAITGVFNESVPQGSNGHLITARAHQNQ